jgi:hypothetical protein
MSAVVGVLNESLTEAIKAFYKLRKAYITLDGILEAEERYIKTHHNGSGIQSERQSTESLPAPRAHEMPGGFGDDGPHESSHPLSSVENVRKDSKAGLESKPPPHAKDPDDTDEEDEFHDANESHEQKHTPHTYIGRLEVEERFEEVDTIDGHMESMSISTKYHLERTSMMSPSSSSPKLPRKLMVFDHDPDSDVFANHIDLFVHSGANLCFGLLLLIISLIPPAFGKLLYIIGFRGDRARGIRMLWQASKFDNINGAMAALILLGYYNGLVGFCDILPDSTNDEDDVEGYPLNRLRNLLEDMRSRYPNSKLWLLEDARMQGANRRLDVSIKMLSGDAKASLKQVEALHMFEKSLISMYSHNYALCAESFLSCVELNNWSRALYYYNAASAHLELYRVHKTKDPAAAQVHAEKAKKYYHEVPNHTGKKRFMARQLPFDVFVARKIQKWEARAKEWNCDFVDAVGVSPMEEMAFFWNGYKKMPESGLQESLAHLAWSESPENKNWVREGLDERSILFLLRAAVYRNLRRHEDAKALLKKEILQHDKSAFKGYLKDDWTAPVAHYEMAVNFWMERKGYQHQYGSVAPQAGDLQQSNFQRRVEAGDLEALREEQKTFVKADEPLVRDCKEWIEKVARWDSYDLDARVGLKVTTARETVAKWGERWGITL